MLTVLSVAYPFADAGPAAVGGAEQVLTTLDEALVAAGHRSLVLARAGSRTAGTLIATPRFDGIIDGDARRAAAAAQRAALRRVLHSWRVDLVHMHGLDFHAVLPPDGPPVLVTLHLPLAWYPPAALRPTRPRTFLHAVSVSQHASRPAGVELLEPITNGVTLERLRPTGEAQGDFALVLGRLCPEKGFHLAITAAELAAVPLVIAGEVFPYAEHRSYFENEIAPRLGSRVQFAGPVADRAKQSLLSRAICLLVPSLVEETSSLVAMEALACGTPVVAFPAGALSELVEPGVTGFLVNDTREMAACIRAARRLAPARCRAAARERFDAARMSRRYLARYHELTGAGEA